MSKTVTKAISELLKPLPIQHKLSAVDLNNGNVPVYSAETQNSGVKGFYTQAEFKIDKNDFRRQKYIVFGDHTRSVNVVTRDFCVMDNVKVLVPIHENLSLEYIKSQWYNNIPNLGYARHWKIAKNVKIKIPINNDGLFDLEKQREIAKKHLDVEQKRSILLKKIEELKKSKIHVEEDRTIQYKLISLNDMVTHCNGNANYTKEWCNLHTGAIPVYSANNKEPFAYSDTADYDGRFLTYSKNGCAGYIKIIDGKFSINGDRCVIKLNSGFEKVNLQYLKYYLEPIFRKNIKGRIGINGKNEYTKINSTMIKKLNILVPIPIDDSGVFDVKKQQELAMKYATIETIKENIYNQIYSLTNIIIN